MLKSFVAGLFLFTCLTTQALALDRGFWVIVGNFPQDEINPAAQRRIESRAAHCGFETFNDFSFKFGFNPGYMVFVLGAYATKSEAKAVLNAVRRCVPDAYIKQGAYSGE